MGVMTVYQVMPGVMICFSDIHMEKCTSEFELKKDMKVLCIDHSREGRIEMGVRPVIFPSCVQHIVALKAVSYPLHYVTNPRLPCCKGSG